MEFMSLVLLFIFSVLFAMGFNYGFPRLAALPQAQKFSNSYAGKTGITAVAVFLLLIGVSFVMSFAYRKPSLPSA